MPVICFSYVEFRAETAFRFILRCVCHGFTNVSLEYKQAGNFWSITPNTQQQDIGSRARKASEQGDESSITSDKFS